MSASELGKVPVVYEREIEQGYADFNPKIFHPAWFSNHELIGEHECNETNVEVIHSDIALFSFEWMRLQVTRDRLDLSTTQEPFFEVIRDLAMGTFQVLEHTPVTMFGINQQLHFKMENEEAWHNLGHKLAPKEDWLKVLKNPGMQRVSIKSARSDEYKGNIIVTVEPSSKIKNGVYIGINDHYELDVEEGTSATPQLLNILQNNWESMRQSSLLIPQAILES